MGTSTIVKTQNLSKQYGEIHCVNHTLSQAPIFHDLTT